MYHFQRWVKVQDDKNNLMWLARQRIYIMWLLLELNFCSAAVMEVKFIFCDVLKSFIKENVNENIFDILFYWKEATHVIMHPQKRK